MERFFTIVFTALATAALLCAFITPSKAAMSDLDWPTLLATGSRCSGLPEELILSIIWKESRGNPNAVNVNGVGGFFPQSPRQALKIIYSYNRSNTDIGLMQVNWKSWGRVFRLRAVDLLDPVTNVCVGSKILREYIDEHPGSWRGVGRYNAVSYDKQYAYASSVGRIYKKIRSIYKHQPEPDPEADKDTAKAETVSQRDLVTEQAESEAQN